jgi:hypothetical protein
MKVTQLGGNRCEENKKAFSELCLVLKMVEGCARLKLRESWLKLLSTT